MNKEAPIGADFDTTVSLITVRDESRSAPIGADLNMTQYLSLQNVLELNSRRHTIKINDIMIIDTIE